MGKSKDIFQRIEKKYLLTEDQYQTLRQQIAFRMGTDEYSRSTIRNIYLDTPNFQLIRQSLSKPVYKEKLRLRCYSLPQADSTSFLEIKKKYRHVVYKRRITLPYGEAMDYLTHGTPPAKDSQILHEIDWFRQLYPGLAPAMIISYDRLALFETENPDFRLTFDHNILWRNYDLDLCHGVYGNSLLAPGQHLMEIKIPGALPLWMCQALENAKIYPCSYSKYGKAYQTLLTGEPQPDERRFIHSA